MDKIGSVRISPGASSLNVDDGIENPIGTAHRHLSTLLYMMSRSLADFSGCHTGGCKTHFARTQGVGMMSSRLSQFASFPKFKDEHTMPFTKGQSDDLSDLRDMAYGWGKIVSRRAYGEEGPGLDIDFDSIESLAVDMGQAVIRGAIEEVLRDPIPTPRRSPALSRVCAGPVP